MRIHSPVLGLNKYLKTYPLFGRCEQVAGGDVGHAAGDCSPHRLLQDGSQGETFSSFLCQLQNSSNRRGGSRSEVD